MLDLYKQLKRFFVYKQLKRFFVLLVGSIIVLVGVFLIFTPGPAIIVIPFGLAILATEFSWAKSLLKKFKNKTSEISRGAKEVLKKTKR
ncbi:MAG: hypothetical protein CMD90_02060 [Gammaproteobacteria bacterium]|nr:hypothetical protein [Gammaproteobacteria bacterium]|tara:strand:+ start:3963 stop:4229 length:267 start_codon:yes stop_codon:yes gene_type:complete